MKISDLHIALVNNRSALNYEDADTIIETMHDDMIENNRDPDELLYEYGLEADYVFDVIEWNQQ